MSGKKNADDVIILCVCVGKVPEGVSVGAVVLLNEDCCSTTLLELPLLMETPETTLDQDGCQGHPLIKCILRDKTAACCKLHHQDNVLRLLYTFCCLEHQ